MTRSSGAREGDWKCSDCSNRNYAFRSLCNRCKQPRILVDTDSQPDSKWLPRLGDWICAGCSNNNYASREKCNKCGKLKDVVALPIAVAAAAGAVSAPLPPSTLATNGSAVTMGLMPTPISLGSWNMNPVTLRNVRLSDPAGNAAGGGWRAGDWTCSCGFMNYASRTTCKQCHALPAMAMPQQAFAPVGYQVSGVKRQASEELSSDWVTKRPHVDILQPAYMASLPPYGAWDERSSLVLGLSSAGLNLLPSIGLPGPPLQGPPPNVGKGAKHWRVGDWICSNCDNHNYASRECCNRCGREKNPDSMKV